MRIILPILFILSSSHLIAQNQLSDSLFWEPNYKLAWTDFKGEPNSTEPYYSDKIAASSVEIIARGYWENGLPNFKVDAIFVRSESWYRDSVFYDHVLAHEQLHFDITELYRRKIKNQVVKFRDLNCKDMTSYTDVINDLIEEFYNFSDLYDSQTNHGVNYSQQKLWFENICNELRKY